MLYQSTRGGGELKRFEEVLLSTYASNGGLYVPVSVPQLSKELLESWRDFNFATICAHILHLFSDIDLAILLELSHDAFSQFNGDGSDPIPLRRFDEVFFLDTSQGPTLAFKDIGLQMIGRILNYLLHGKQNKAAIIVETSGDTGPAAIAGVKGCEHVDIFCLYPNHRVSLLQELQMITNNDPNVHIYRTEGNSDEQASVLKGLFADEDFVKQYHVCSVNSINWVRIATQSSYYVWVYLQLKYHIPHGLRDKKEVNFVVPTGAFGNAMGGYLAQLMGIPIGKIICATNANDIVYRTITRGDMRMGANVATESPAMDIQFAYNLERMLFYMCGQDAERVSQIMHGLEEQFQMIAGAEGVQLPEDLVKSIQEVFDSLSVSDEDTLATIRAVYDKFGMEICPHSAIGVHAAWSHQDDGFSQVCVLTAHPAKFEATMTKALGRPPKMPHSLELMKTLPHHFECLQKESADWRQEWMRIIQEEVRRRCAGKSV